MGQLIPIGCVEVLPSDLFNHQTNVLIRVSPLAAPVMHQCTVRVHHWYVRNRNLWNTKEGDSGDWEDFLTGGEDGTDTQTVPKFASTSTAKDLQDYFGIPRVAGVNISELPIRGFNKIWNEFYRDQDTETERAIDAVTVPNISWEKDYFTTARPWAQKGTAASLPIGTKADIRTDATASQTLGIIDNDGSSRIGIGTDTANAYRDGGTSPPAAQVMYADLTNATSATVNQLREAIAAQQFAENRARYGARYVEYISYLGGGSGDLNRPIYLGGGQAQLNFSEVLQTANDSTDRAYGVGDLYGHGIAAMKSNRYVKQFNEHGYVITLLSVRPRAIYTNGIHRTWLRTDREDFHDPILERMGVTQEIYENEIYADAADANSADVFGYNDLYADYRGVPSYVSAEFRSTLNYWHLGRSFGSQPTINSTFTSCTPSKRIFNEQTNNSLWIMAHHSIGARRVVKKNSTPEVF